MKEVKEEFEEIEKLIRDYTNILVFGENNGVMTEMLKFTTDLKGLIESKLKEARIGENKFHQECFLTKEQQVIFIYQIFEDRIKELSK